MNQSAGRDAGSITVRLVCAAGCVGTVHVESTRPRVERVLIGQPAELAMKRVPLLFALCGKAQGHAARLALAAARGIDTPLHLAADVEREAMREHLWRLLLDLPAQLGFEAQTDLFQAAWRAVAADDRAAVTELLGATFWNELVSGLERLDSQTGVPASVTGDALSLLPLISAAQSCEIWPQLDADFARLPTWRTQPAETGAYARWGGQNPAQAGPLAARWHARCAEVWSWAAGESKVGAGGTASAVPLATGVGRALVDTARGLLMHQITLDGETIADYVIVAPTEWNFHPLGVLNDWLRSQPADDAQRLSTRAGHAIAALDPCVAWQIAIVNSE